MLAIYLTRADSYKSAQGAGSNVSALTPREHVDRAQRGLDVETGKPFDASHPPIDQRVRAQ